MFRNNLLLVLFILGLSSCNPVGEEITALDLSEGEIATAENVTLKKGDVVTIWAKVTSSSEDKSPAFRVKFNIETKGQSILLDSLNVSNEDHVINSKKTKESYSQSSSKGDSTIYYTLHEYETESRKFTAPYDGKYAFDFKLMSQSNSFGFNHSKLSIILRK
ncbi:hypothetical protein G6M26_07275 [Agrobacterium tumefaciens]|nr:hypothetical protein [Agrobacterium tumefaciens]NTE18321.1 hypothetical protein [Agrobacterium tumefaciens]